MMVANDVFSNSEGRNKYPRIERGYFPKGIYSAIDGMMENDLTLCIMDGLSPEEVDQEMQENWGNRYLEVRKWEINDEKETIKEAQICKKEEA